MEKDFDAWAVLKKELNSSERIFYVHSRGIWWCSLGVNIGAEIDGKHERFERPVVVMKVYNKETLVILPITSKEKNNIFHYKIETEAKVAWVKLTQARVISTKRLIRKVDVLDEVSFRALQIAWKDVL